MAATGPERPVDGSQTRRSRQYNAALAGSAVFLLALGVILARWDTTVPEASNYAQITSDGQPKIGPLLTDGLRLYFTEGSLNHFSLMQIAASGGETRALTSSLETPHLMDMAPSRSDLLIGLGAPSHSVLWTIAIPSSGLRRVGDVQADDATWSPDGREVAYVRGNDLYRARNDGSGARRLTTFPGILSWPRWSPDGSCLRATVTDSITGFSSLWEVPADGGTPHPILAGWNPTPLECCGSWTPGGHYFIFQATRDGKTDIWAIREKGRPVFASSGPVRLTYGQMNSLAPLVSPEGKRLYVKIGRAHV